MRAPLIVVSGLPRSGTSLMMGALAAGGLPVVSDGARAADSHNPKGYFEDRRVLTLVEDAEWLRDHQGQGVKILSHLLRAIPSSLPVKVIFMRRPLPQVLASQSAMLGKAGGEDSALASLIARDLTQTLEWLDEQPRMATLQVSYPQVLQSPRDEFQRVVDFLDIPLDVEAMMATVDPALHRQKRA